MADVMGLLREILTLTSEVGGLRGDVDRLVTKVESHHDRILRLESREELLAEKMANTAVIAVNKMTSDYVERLGTLERMVAGSGTPALPSPTRAKPKK